MPEPLTKPVAAEPSPVPVPPLRPDYDSTSLQIMTRPSAETVARVRSYLARENTRYYLSAGAPGFERPLWTFQPGHRVAPPSRWGSSAAAALLSGTARRHATLEDELELIARWVGGARAARLVVTEVFGPPSRQDVLFWQACLSRLDRRQCTPPRLVVLRHDEVPAPATADPAGAEILLALLLSGGYAGRADFERWQAIRGWDADRIDAFTATRDFASETVYTYRDGRRWRQAQAVLAAADRPTVADLAALVVPARPGPLIATAALLDDPGTALAAGTAAGFAGVDAGRNTSTRYGRALYRAGRAGGWTGVSRTAAGAVYLAAIVSDLRRVSPAVADLILGLAERLGLDTGTRATLAFHLGQVLARGTSLGELAAGIRCFERVSAYLTAKPEPDPEFDASRIAAAYNGAAMAAYRAGDRVEAMRAELAALDTLGTAHQRVEQRVMVLANLAAVYAASPRMRRRALTTYREAWRLASTAESLTGLAYVAIGLVPRLLEAGGWAEARNAVLELLRRYDVTPVPPRSAERAVVSACWRLADVRLAGGDVWVAADWYRTAVRCMRRPAPEVVGGILRNLTARLPDCPELARHLLSAELAAHMAMATDAEALASFVEGLESVV